MVNPFNREFWGSSWESRCILFKIQINRIHCNPFFVCAYFFYQELWTKKIECVYAQTQSLEEKQHGYKDEEGDLETIPLHLYHDGYA
jgi:hypothetical protein